VPQHITVYTTGPACHRCTLTKKWLTQRGHDFTEVRVERRPETLAELQNRGFSDAPVVRVIQATGGELWWSGFRPSQLELIQGGAK
jgi:glutaredoxin-like protein NrdH